MSLEPLLRSELETITIKIVMPKIFKAVDKSLFILIGFDSSDEAFQPTISIYAGREFVVVSAR
jgi:hypothetical protein